MAGKVVLPALRFVVRTIPPVLPIHLHLNLP